jgi:hypothetical protein
VVSTTTYVSSALVGVKRAGVVGTVGAAGGEVVGIRDDVRGVVSGGIGSGIVCGITNCIICCIGF